jgi:hypothetical protein
MTFNDPRSGLSFNRLWARLLVVLGTDWGRIELRTARVTYARRRRLYASIPGLGEPEQDLRRTLQIIIASECYSKASDSFYRTPGLGEPEQNPQTDLADLHFWLQTVIASKGLRRLITRSQTITFEKTGARSSTLFRNYLVDASNLLLNRRIDTSITTTDTLPSPYTPKTIHKMADEKDGYRIPILDRSVASSDTIVNTAVLRGG